MKLRCLIVRAFLAAGLGVGALPVAGAADVVDERIAGFKESKRGIASIEDAIQRGDAMAAADHARSLALFAQLIPSLYPAEAKGGFFSKAKNDIWLNFSDFSQKASAFQIRAQQLEASARTGSADAGALNRQVRALKETCVACHRQYKRGPG